MIAILLLEQGSRSFRGSRVLTVCCEIACANGSVPIERVTSSRAIAQHLMVDLVRIAVSVGERWKLYVDGQGRLVSAIFDNAVKYPF